eukprot:g2168.t1
MMRIRRCTTPPNRLISTWKQQCISRGTSSISEIQTNIKKRHVNARETCELWLHQLHRSEPTINSFLLIDEDSALAQATKLDLRLDQGENCGLLSGVPIAIKDNICTEGMTTTAGSKILQNFKPTYDATVIEKLKSAGAIIVGKTNLDEFGMGSSTENSAYKVTCNPWDPTRVPGGSSGGSAAAVAANQCGSIRQPAHFCGCVGIKPSYGRVSRFGLISYGSSLDTIGPLARTVKDAALVFQVIAGEDPKDSTSVQHPVPNFASNLPQKDSLSSCPLSGIRLGLVKETQGEGVDPRILQVLHKTAQCLQTLGAEIEEVSIEAFEIGLPSYYIIALSEASSNLSRYDAVRYGVRQKSVQDLGSLYMESRAAGLGPEVKRRILMGTYALSAGYYDAYYKRAQQVRRLLTTQLNEALSGFDGLLTPAAPVLPWKIGEFVSDPLTMYKGDLMSVGCNLAGLPGVVFPAGMVEAEPGLELPVGIQLIGKSFREEDIINIAHVLELCMD